MVGILPAPRPRRHRAAGKHETGIPKHETNPKPQSGKHETVVRFGAFRISEFDPA